MKWNYWYSGYSVWQYSIQYSHLTEGCVSLTDEETYSTFIYSVVLTVDWWGWLSIIDCCCDTWSDSPEAIQWPGGHSDCSDHSDAWPGIHCPKSSFSIISLLLLSVLSLFIIHCSLCVVIYWLLICLFILFISFDDIYCLFVFHFIDCYLVLSAFRDKLYRELCGLSDGYYMTWLCNGLTGQYVTSDAMQCLLFRPLGW